jgi:hypothetical protein
MMWKVFVTFFPRVSTSTSPRTPAYFPVPPLRASTLLGGGSGSLGKLLTPCVLISLPGRVYVYVHSVMWAFSLGSSAGSVTTQNKSRRPILCFPLSL